MPRWPWPRRSPRLRDPLPRAAGRPGARFCDSLSLASIRFTRMRKPTIAPTIACSRRGIETELPRRCPSRLESLDHEIENARAFPPRRARARSRRARERPHSSRSAPRRPDRRTTKASRRHAGRERSRWTRRRVALFACGLARAKWPTSVPSGSQSATWRSGRWLTCGSGLPGVTSVANGKSWTSRAIVARSRAAKWSGT